jgi:peptide-methionine (S)-S-oxide reductase
MGKNLSVATLAGGCFWCLEAVFDELNGVQSVESGYTGGQVPNPTYQQVCNGDTGHAEAVQITFDPSSLTYHYLM